MGPAYSPMAAATAPRPRAKKMGFSLPACGEAAKKRAAERMSKKSCSISTAPFSPSAEYCRDGNQAGKRINTEPNAIRINTRRKPSLPLFASLGMSLNGIKLTSLLAASVYRELIKTGYHPLLQARRLAQQAAHFAVT